MASFSWQRSRSTENAICSICLEQKKNRRRLPCRHSFCLRCLERHCGNRAAPGSDVLCPLCRATFQIPRDGLDGWRDPPSDERGDAAGGDDGGKRCEVCSTADDVRPAEVYCVDCSQLLCERCSLPHRKMRGGAHVVIELTEPSRDGDEPTSKGPVDACRRAVLHVESQSREFSESVATVKQQVRERGEAVKRVVDGHVRDLLAQVDRIESDAMNEASLLTETLKTALSATFCAADVSGAEPQSQLLMCCLEAGIYEAPEVAFIPSSVDELTRNEKNTVGSVLNNRTTGKRMLLDFIVTKGQFHQRRSIRQSTELKLFLTDS